MRASDHLYIEATLLPTYLAPGEFPDKLLNEVGAVSVGSRSDRAVDPRDDDGVLKNTKRLILAITDEGVSSLTSLISSGGSTREQKDAFDEIRKVDSIGLAEHIEITSDQLAQTDELLDWEAVFNPGVNAEGQVVPIDDETMEKWYRLVARFGGEDLRAFARTVGTLTFAPVTLSAKSASELRLFNPLRSLRPMPTLKSFTGPKAFTSTRVLPPFDFGPISNQYTIGVFDTGLDIGPSGSPFFPEKAIDLTPVKSKSSIAWHGTGVTGAAMYGLLRPGDRAQTPPLRVMSYRLDPIPQMREGLKAYWVLDRIKEAVEKKPHLLVNISYSPNEPINDLATPDRWTSELDALSWEHNVLFVAAGGNNGYDHLHPEERRIQIPADMANGLTVGACDAASPTVNWKRPDYSSVGPGRSGNRVMPTCVQFGGSDNGDFPVLTANGTVRYDSGSSFASPIAVHALAELSTRVPRPSPSVLRAFVVHFCERHKKLNKMLDEVGYGRAPLTFTDALICRPYEVHVLYQDSIDLDQAIGYKLPLTGVSKADLEFRVTLAFACPTDPAEAVDYTRASLNLTFRPDQRMNSYRSPKGSTPESRTLDKNSAEARQLKNAGWTESQEAISKSLRWFGNAAPAQLDLSSSWETLRYGKILLRAGNVFEPRIDLSYVRRRPNSRGGEPKSIPFAMLVTILDRSGNEDIYDAAISQFPMLQALPEVDVPVSIQT